jgi:hypothetical protein
MQLRDSHLADRLNIQAPVSCGQCGERLFWPAWSEQVDACRVRHFWTCEACDYAFETLVKFPAPAEEVAIS